MYKDKFKIGSMIFAIINQECEIYYTNIESQVAYDYIEKLHVLNHLHTNLPIQYTSGNHYISVDKFIVTD